MTAIRDVTKTAVVVVPLDEGGVVTAVTWAKRAGDEQLLVIAERTTATTHLAASSFSGVLKVHFDDERPTYVRPAHAVPPHDTL